MNIEQIAAFADKTPLVNQRTVVNLKDGSVYTGYFFKNPKLPNKKDNLWHFVIPATATTELVNLTFNGDDIDSIKIINLF